MVDALEASEGNQPVSFVKLIDHLAARGMLVFPAFAAILSQKSHLTAMALPNRSSLWRSVTVGADPNAHAGSSEADTAAPVFVVTPALDIALTRSVSI
jgi:hypothetical protein